MNRTHSEGGEDSPGVVSTHSIAFRWGSAELRARECLLARSKILPEGIPGAFRGHGGTRTDSFPVTLGGHCERTAVTGGWRAVTLRKLLVHPTSE